MSMYYLIEYIDNYSKSSGSFYQYYRDEPDLIHSGHIIYFPDVNANNNTASFKFETTGVNRKLWKERCWNNGTFKISK